MPANAARRKSGMSDHEVLSTITDPNRWQILQRLNETKTSKELAKELGMRPAAVQYHLKALVEAGVVDEWSIPEYPNRYTYSRRDVRGTILIKAQRVSAEVKVV